MSLSDQIRRINQQHKERNGPLWEGPSSAGPNGGITQSLLSRWLICRERFRLYAVEGLRSADDFNHRIEYGSLWHVAEEGWARWPDSDGWLSKLNQYATELLGRYPYSREQIEHWANVARVQFPLYVSYWKSQPATARSVPLLQEQVFDVLYRLSSGRTVRLRGKWDGVDLVGEGTGAGVYLFETKSKGDIDEGQIKRQLSCDLQVMFYLVALDEHKDESFWRRANKSWRGLPIRGVRYNVVRRPLSGGKGSIVRHKATKNHPEETWEHFYGRVAEYISAEPNTYFMRWKCEITEGDVKRFRCECLDPILESLCDWWELISTQKDPYSWVTCLVGSGKIIASPHYRMPFGVRSPLIEGGSTDLDNYLATGSMGGLMRATELFTELKE